MQQYQPSQLAQLVHALPHFNFALNHVSANFNVSSAAYIESLAALSSVPALLLVTALLLLLVYMLSRCCCVSHKQKHTFIGLKWSMGCVATLTCVVLAAGFYGNETVHSGVTSLQLNTGALADTVSNITNLTRSTETLLVQDVSARLENLRQLFMSDSRPANGSIVRWLDTEMTWMGMNISEEVSVLRHIDSDTHHIRANAVSSYIRLSETIRWPAMVMLLSLITVFCILLLVAVVRHSRWLLVFFSVVSLFSLIVCFLLASVYVFVTVGMADFCVWPDMTVRAAVTSQFADERLGSTVATYYLNCSGGASPWQQPLAAAQSHAQLMLTRLDDINNVALKYYPSSSLEPAVAELRTHLSSCQAVYKTMSDALLCQNIHRLYERSLHSLCDTTLVGAVVLVLSLLLCGLALIVLAWCDAHAWIHIQKRRDYLRVDTVDHYGTTCRRPPSLSTLTAVPPGGGAAVSGGGYVAMATRLGRDTPPPLPLSSSSTTRLRPPPPFPTANHGSLRPFSRMTEGQQRAGVMAGGTLPTRYTSAGPVGTCTDPPPYTTALLSSSVAEHSDYDNYN